MICAVSADLGRRADRGIRRTAPLGQLTYSLYMLHLPTLVIARFAAGWINLQGPAHTAFMAAAVLAIFPLAWLSYVLFEAPCRRWVNHLGAFGRDVEGLRPGSDIRETGGARTSGGENNSPPPVTPKPAEAAEIAPNGLRGRDADEWIGLNYGRECGR